MNEPLVLADEGGGCRMRRDGAPGTGAFRPSGSFPRPRRRHSRESGNPCVPGARTSCPPGHMAGRRPARGRVLIFHPCNQRHAARTLHPYPTRTMPRVGAGWYRMACPRAVPDHLAMDIRHGDCAEANAGRNAVGRGQLLPCAGGAMKRMSGRLTQWTALNNERTGRKPDASAPGTS